MDKQVLALFLFRGADAEVSDQSTRSQRIRNRIEKQAYNPSFSRMSHEGLDVERTR